MTDLPPNIAAPSAYVPAAPAPRRSSAMGAVALVLSILVLIGSVIASVVIGTAAVDFTANSGSGFNFSVNANSSDPAEQQLAILVFVHIGVGTLFGVLALVLGIVAAVSRRGRAQGVVAIIVSALAPGLSLVAFFITLGVAASGR